MTSSTSPRWLRSVLAAAFWLVVWQVAGMAIGQDLLVTSPVQVALTLVALVPTGGFWGPVAYSFGRIVLGFVLAVVAGVLLAAASARWKLIEGLLSPLIRAMRSVPVFSFIILVLIWFDASRLSIVISFLMVMPIVYVDVLEGIGNRSRELAEVAAVFGVPAWRRWLGFDLPSVLPFFVAACRVGLGLCWKSGISGEVIGLPQGSIGERLYQAKIFLSTPDLFAWTVAIVAISFAFEKAVLWLLSLAERRLGTVFSR